VVDDLNTVMQWVSCSDYLYRYRFSFDLAGSRLVLAPLTASPAH
jgi:hypothetical protein